MPDWSDPAQVEYDIRVFTKLCLFLLGLYTWDFLSSFGPDWEIISRKRQFRPAQLVYFVCRYSLMGLLIGVNIAMETTTHVNCEALYVFEGLMLGSVLGSASLLLTLRSFVVWSFDKRVTIPLIVLCVGHWGIILRDITGTHASWNDGADTCAVDHMYTHWLAVEFIYTMILDLIILVVTMVGLMRRLPVRNGIRNYLIRDGLIYFICAFVATLIPAVLMMFQLNPIMDFMFAPVAATVNGIVATRSVRRLTNVISVTGPQGQSKATFLYTPPPNGPKVRKHIYVKTEAVTTTDRSPTITPSQSREKTSPQSSCSLSFASPSPLTTRPEAAFQCGSRHDGNPPGIGGREVVDDDDDGHYRVVEKRGGGGGIRMSHFGGISSPPTQHVAFASFEGCVGPQGGAGSGSEGILTEDGHMESEAMYFEPAFVDGGGGGTGVVVGDSLEEEGCTVGVERPPFFSSLSNETENSISILPFIDPRTFPQTNSIHIDRSELEEDELRGVNSDQASGGVHGFRRGEGPGGDCFDRAGDIV